MRKRLCHSKSAAMNPCACGYLGDPKRECRCSPKQVETYVVEPVRWTFGYLENPKKIMFGTDWPLTYPKPYIEAIKRAIPEQHWRAVFYDNAKRVFKLPLP